MGSAELFAWVHAALLLSLAIVGLVALAADGLAKFRSELERQERERAHRLARLHGTAQQLQRGELEA